MTVAEVPSPLSAPSADAASAFGAELVACTPRLRAFIRRLCLREADDVLQECLARAWRSRASFRPDASLEAWLTKIAFRTWLDHQARPQPRRLEDDDLPIAARGDLSVELREEIARALATLGPVEREVLLRFHRDGQSIRQIARALGAPEGTVKSHLHRARARLAEGDRS